MAKRNRHGKENSVIKHNTNTLIAKAKNASEAPRVYANHAQFTINLNEIFIDLYRIEPDPLDNSQPFATMVQRVIVPISLGKGFATGIANLIAGLEAATGIKIANNREKAPEDTIEIWKEE